jgi:hypothetical protein
VVFPDGVGILPWMVPGTDEIGQATAVDMQKHTLVLWPFHGVFGSGPTLDETFGLIDTAEKSAEVLVKVYSMGGMKQTISREELIALGKRFGVSPCNPRWIYTHNAFAGKTLIVKENYHELYVGTSKISLHGAGAIGDMVNLVANKQWGKALIVTDGQLVKLGLLDSLFPRWTPIRCRIICLTRCSRTRRKRWCKKDLRLIRTRSVITSLPSAAAARLIPPKRSKSSPPTLARPPPTPASAK